jgi:hypothetical protein
MGRKNRGKFVGFEKSYKCLYVMRRAGGDFRASKEGDRMDGVRSRSNLWVFSGLLAVLLMLSSSWSIANAASDRNDRTRTVNSATLHERVGETLVFVADRGGRIWKLKGKLDDQSQILNEKDDDLDLAALELGSVWALKIEYPIQEGGPLVIVEMKRIRPKAPE